MTVALDILALVVVVGVVAWCARRLGWPEPLVLVVVGIGLSFVPHVLEISLSPDLVLIGLLPPLLYAAAIRTSLIDFKANRRPILLLSVGLVAFSTVATGLVTWWVVPGVTLAAGFAIGAVVAPPDAVAATTVARRVGMPRRVVSILEGESLVNDATALVALNTAIAAITTSVSVWHVGWDFVRAAGGGILVGLLAAFVLARVRRLIDDVVLDTTLSFAAPYIAFLPAEEIHASGVLAVVVTGLLLGHRAPVLQSASSRIAENINWRTVQFLLENVVFLLIGLQVRRILSSVSRTHLAWGTVVGSLPRRAAGGRAGPRACGCSARCSSLRLLRRPTWSWKVSVIVSWAGMRGVVTLAAVFVLPTATPQRALLTLAAFTVVAGTLLIQGLTLPWLVRRLALPGPDVAEDALQAAGLVNTAANAGLAVLDEVATDDDPPEVLEALRDRAMSRSNRIWEQLGRSQHELEPPSATYRRLRLQMLSAERGVHPRGPRPRRVRRRGAPHVAAGDRPRGVDARPHRRRVRPRRPGTHHREPARRRVRAPAGRAARLPREHPRRVRGVPAGRHALGAPAAVPAAAGTSAAATPRSASTRPRTSTSHGIPSCARSSPARPGAGATRTRCWADGTPVG